MCRKIGNLLVLWVLLCPTVLYAAMDGYYSGTYQGKPVTLVLETMHTTVTGVATIAGQRYMLLADIASGAVSGELSDIQAGRTLKLQIKPEGERLDVSLTPVGSPNMHFKVKRQQ